MSDDGDFNPGYPFGSPPPPAVEPETTGLEPVLAAGAATAERGSRSRGTHRARTSPGVWVGLGLLVAVVLALIGIGLYGWLGGGTKQASNPAPHPSVPVGTVSTGPTASTSPSASTVSPSPSASPSASASSKPTPSSKPTAAPPPPVVHARVVVLNETTNHGLAARTAARLTAKGWTVTGVGNWRGQIGSTTVYFAPGLEAAARSLAYDLGGARIRPVVAGMLRDRLTVVLTSDPFG